jgi:3-phosphoshikimate 1-carboxyvinyltransferase
MIYTLTAPSSIHVTIQLPTSKSISNRVLILNALSKNALPVKNLSDSDDTRVLQRALESRDSVFDVGAAGTSMRFLTAYLSQLPGQWLITGTERMKNRPIRILVDTLRETGGEIRYLEKAGFPPLQITGKRLVGGDIHLNGGVSSQYLSALMMIAPCMEKGLHIFPEGNIISRPYIEMTRRLMQIFGVETHGEGANIRIEPQHYHAIPFTIESDWSAASYWYEIIALSEGKAKIELPGLEINSLQGDSKCAELFKQIGLVPEIQYDFVNQPDLAQTFIVTCCLLNIPFQFTGLQSLRIKETDRIAALQTELKKLGYLITNQSDHTLEWKGERCEPEPDPIIETYEDHRMAMAFAPACLKTGKIKINNPQVVSKSYPVFWKDLEKAGFSINIEV